MAQVIGPGRTPPGATKLGFVHKRTRESKHAYRNPATAGAVAYSVLSLDLMAT